MSGQEDEVPPGPAAFPRQRAGQWAALTTVGLGTLMTTMEGGVTNIVSPALVEAFSTDISTVLWFSVIFMVVSTGMLLTLGWVGDTLGRRRVFLAGFAVFTAGLALVAVAQDLVQLFLFRAVQATGSACILSNGNAIVTGAVPAHQRGKALGIMNGVVGVGLATGPLVGGVLLDVLDWRALFWTRLPIGLLGLAFAFQFLKEDRTRPQGPLRVDYWGILLLYGTLGTFLLALNQVGRSGVSSAAVWVPGIAALVLLPLLVVVERRAHRPVLDLALFRHRVFLASQGSLFFHFVPFGALSFLAPFYLLGGLGLSATAMGLMIATLPLTRIVIGPVGGLLYDKIGSRIPTLVGLVVMAVGLLLLSQLGGEAQVWGIVAVFAVIGVGAALFDAANNSAIMGTVPRDRLGSASAFIPTGRQTARSSGIALGGAIFVTQLGSSTTALGGQPVVVAFGDTMLVMALLVVVGAIITWFRGKA